MAVVRKKLPPPRKMSYEEQRAQAARDSKAIQSIDLRSPLEKQARHAAAYGMGPTQFIEHVRRAGPLDNLGSKHAAWQARYKEAQAKRPTTLYGWHNHTGHILLGQSRRMEEALEMVRALGIDETTLQVRDSKGVKITVVMNHYGVLRKK